MVKIGYYFSISSFLPGTLDQITIEKAFCKAKALCEYRIISSSLLYNAQIYSHAHCCYLEFFPCLFWWG